MVELGSELERDIKMTVIDQDEHVRISFNRTSRLGKMELLPDFNEMNIEGLHDTLVILSDVIMELEIDKLLVDSQGLGSRILEHLGGLEFYTAILKGNRSLRKLAILSGDGSEEALTSSLSKKSVSRFRIEMFMNEGEAVE